MPGGRRRARLDARRRRSRPDARARARVAAHARRRADRDTRRAAARRIRRPSPASLARRPLRRRRAGDGARPRPDWTTAARSATRQRRRCAGGSTYGRGLLRHERTAAPRSSSPRSRGPARSRCACTRDARRLPRGRGAASSTDRRSRSRSRTSRARPPPRAARRLRARRARAHGGRSPRREEAGFERAARRAPRRPGRERWETADVVIEGDPQLQRAVRFALFHLMASVTDEGEAAVGARGLYGPGLPRPRLLGQRRLRPAVPCRDAPAGGARDARVPHPPPGRGPRRGCAALGLRGRPLPVGVGARRRRRHAQRTRTSRPARSRASAPASRRSTSSADVAWAAACYLDWTGDVEFAAGPGRELLSETARYWASRVRFDRGGRAHIYGVIGPDEYHEPVDDNAFTNVMARWNLREAAALDGVEAERRALVAARRRARRRLRPDERPLRAVRRLLTARAARDRRRRASAPDCRRPAARRASARPRHRC